MAGKFITFEGIDGSGKSTQLRMLADELRRRSVDVVVTFEPGATPLGRRLREAFLESEETVAPMAELLLFAADRAQHVGHVIRPALTDGRLVISDRYADATVAYQGGGRGFSEEIIDAVIKLATGGLKPDLTLFFDIPVARSLERLGDRQGTPNRMDLEGAAFYDRVRRAYLDIALGDPGRVKVIDADGTPEDVHAEVVQLVTAFIG